MDESGPRRPPRGGAHVHEAEVRNYVDPDGVAWTVREHTGQHGPSLVFASSEAVRRVLHYPGDWWMLSVPDLIRLSWAS